MNAVCRSEYSKGATYAVDAYDAGDAWLVTIVRGGILVAYRFVGKSDGVDIETVADAFIARAVVRAHIKSERRVKC